MIKVQKILSTLLNAVAFMLSNISIAISQDSYIKRVSQIIRIGSESLFASWLTQASLLVLNCLTISFVFALRFSFIHFCFSNAKHKFTNCYFSCSLSKREMLHGELSLSSIIIVAKYGNKNTFSIQRDRQYCI